MKLSKKNIRAWKSKVADVAEPTLGRELANCLTDAELLKDYVGTTPEEYVMENIEAAI